MTRSEWQKIANEHIRSARSLLASGHYSGAYYLAGFAVECALKAKISRAFKKDTWPDRRFVQEIHSHDIDHLLKNSALTLSCQNEMQRSAAFRAYWNTVRQWSIESRYKEWSHAEAQDMIDAVSKRSSGVLAWIKRHW